MTEHRPTTTERPSPRTSTLGRPTLMTLAATEYERLGQLLHQLSGAEWQQPTDCPEWNVRDMAGHVVGMAEMAGSIHESVRQQRLAAKRDGEPIDALTAVQVDKLRDLSTDELVARIDRIGPKAAKGRRRTPSFIRGRTMPGTQLVGEDREEWTFGYLIDTILTRDPWMHRIDISRAVGRSVNVTAEHDGVLVADVVDEWATRHGQSFDLTLTGPAGGHWSRGSGGETIDLDALEFCRILSGRGSGVGLLATVVPF